MFPCSNCDSLRFSEEIWFKTASMQGKTARIWRVFGGERDNSRQKSRFHERKVARKPGMLPQTTLLKCMRMLKFKIYIAVKSPVVEIAGSLHKRYHFAITSANKIRSKKR